MSNIPTKYEDYHYDSDQTKQQALYSLIYPAPHCFNPLPSHIIPIIKSSMSMSYDGSITNTLKELLPVIEHNINIHELSYLDCPAMFDFHCNHLISDGTLAKRFGQHDDLTLKELYTKHLFANKLIVDQFMAYINNPNICTPSDIQGVLNFLKTVDSKLRYRGMIAPITMMHHTMKLLKGFTGDIKPINDQFDFSEYIPVVPDNVTDEELLALYDKYPEYKDVECNNQYITLPNGLMNRRSEYPCCFEFILRITREDIVDQVNRDIRGDHESSQDDMQWFGLTCRAVRRTITRYIYDQQTSNMLRNCTFDELISLAEIEWDKHPDERFTISRDKLLQLKTRDAIIIRFDTCGNIIG